LRVVDFGVDFVGVDVWLLLLSAGMGTTVDAWTKVPVELVMNVKGSPAAEVTFVNKFTAMHSTTYVMVGFPNVPRH
jgi:hypothetical protein